MPPRNSNKHGRSIKSICVIASAYPNPYYSAQPFIEQLVCAFIELGIKCYVIAPRSISNSIIRKNPLPPKLYRMVTKTGIEYNVYFPRFISSSSFKFRFSSVVGKMNINLFKRAAFKVVENNSISADVFYAHFFQPSGFAAAELSQKYSKPFFVACGENYLDYLDTLGLEWSRENLKNISGVIAVSTENKNKVTTRNLVEESKIQVFPNAINNNIFYKRDKKEARKKLGVKDDDFIVCFVGRRVHVKGTLRLSAALKETNNVKSFFIGPGEETPDCDNVLFCGSLMHNEVPEYLSASDVFVLPTLAEGCCNAIIEAMACGLPVISSDLPFNYDVLNHENAIMIDPNNISEIRDAIIKMQNSPELIEKMSKAALETAANLDIKTRARDILDFMNKHVYREDYMET